MRRSVSCLLWTLMSKSTALLWKFGSGIRGSEQPHPCHKFSSHPGVFFCPAGSTDMKVGNVIDTFRMYTKPPQSSTTYVLLYVMYTILPESLKLINLTFAKLFIIMRCLRRFLSQSALFISMKRTMSFTYS